MKNTAGVGNDLQELFERTGITGSLRAGPDDRHLANGRTHRALGNMARFHLTSMMTFHMKQLANGSFLPVVDLPIKHVLSRFEMSPLSNPHSQSGRSS